MRKLFSILFCLISMPARADVVYFETGSSLGERAQFFTAKLKNMEVNPSGMATFSYKNGQGEEKSFDVHISRIYSIEFTKDDYLGRDLPQFRANIMKPLPDNLDTEQIKIFLKTTNERYLYMDEGFAIYYQDLNIKVDKEEKREVIFGTITNYAPGSGFDITCLNNKRETISISNVPTRFLQMWIRD